VFCASRGSKSLGRFEVNHQLELGRLFHGQVAGLCALEDLVDKRRRAPVDLSDVHAVGHEAPSLDELGKVVNRG
jgi:hypothetical protein